MREVIATVTNTKRFFADSGNAIIEVLTQEQETMILIGRTEGNEEVGLCYRFGITSAKEYTYRDGTKEQQHRFNSWTPYEPKERKAVIRYLAACGKGLGVGPVTAEKMFDKLGENVLDLLRHNHMIAVEQFRVSEENARKLQNKLYALYAVEATKIELDQMFERFAVPKSTIETIIETLGVAAPAKIRRNPYCLLKFKGIGFRKADAMYVAFGLPLDRIKRQALSMAHKIDSDGSGSVWHPAIDLATYSSQHVGTNSPNPLKAIRLGLRAKLLAKSRRGDTDQDLWIADRKLARMEKEVCQDVFQLCNESYRGTVDWPDPDLLRKCTDHQKTAFQDAITRGMGILEGGPGTGKTFSVCEAVRAIGSRFGFHGIQICAPTNKAAKRLSEGLAENDLPLRATTTHSMLGMRVSRGKWEFNFNKTLPLPARYVFFDEFSMADLEIFHAFLQAINPRTTRVMLIGDVNQLPPVGAGAPLRDLLGAGIPTGRLTEVKRNSGRIVELCRQIRDGEPLVFSQAVTPEENCKFIECKPDAIFSKIIDILRMAQVHGYDPLWDVQPIVPINEKSEVSRKDVNLRLQTHFNEHGKRIGECRFRVGDKIVVTARHEAKLIDGDNLRDCVINNGEIGSVIALTSNSMDIDIDGVKFRRYYKGKDVPCIDLGYGISGHKSQGSEWPVAIPVIDGSGAGMRVSSREWIYTALSRGKAYSFPLGSRTTLNRQLRNVTILKRKTFLREDLQCLFCDEPKDKESLSIPSLENESKSLIAAETGSGFALPGR